jgi:hypothetical protein
VRELKYAYYHARAVDNEERLKANYSRQKFRVEMFVFVYKSTLRVRKSESKSLYCLSGNVCSKFALTYPASSCLGY